jgi:hypothetical protein
MNKDRPQPVDTAATAVRACATRWLRLLSPVTGTRGRVRLAIRFLRVTLTVSVLLITLMVIWVTAVAIIVLICYLVRNGLFRSPTGSVLLITNLAGLLTVLVRFNRRSKKLDVRRTSAPRDMEPGDTEAQRRCANNPKDL